MRDLAMLTSILQSHARRIRAVWTRMSRSQSPTLPADRRDAKARVSALYETDWGSTILSYDNVY